MTAFWTSETTFKHTLKPNLRSSLCMAFAKQKRKFEILSVFDTVCFICIKFPDYMFNEFKIFGILCSGFNPGSPPGYNWDGEMVKLPHCSINICLVIRAFTYIFLTEEINELMFGKLEQTISAMWCQPWSRHVTCIILGNRTCSLPIAFII